MAIRLKRPGAEYFTECPLCRSSRIRKYGEKRLIKRLKPINFIDAEEQFLLDRLKRNVLVRSIYLCCSCSFLFQNPTFSDEELKALYNDKGPGASDYYKILEKSGERRSNSILIKNFSNERKRRYAKIILSCRGSKILDYGGGTGNNLTHSLLKNTKRYVYDFGRENISGPGITSLKDINFDMQFDFILNTHVLEHEPCPLNTLLILRKIISPEGTLYLEVPFEYVERILTRRPGTVWHINYFNRKTIIEMANRSGWRCESIRLVNLPYSGFKTNCLMAILRPDTGGHPCNRFYLSALLLKDFVVCLANRVMQRYLPG